MDASFLGQDTEVEGSSFGLLRQCTTQVGAAGAPTLGTFGVLNDVVLSCCVLCANIILIQDTEVEGSSFGLLRQCMAQVNAADAVLRTHGVLASAVLRCVA